jgi:hypothetical protein
MPLPPCYTLFQFYNLEVNDFEAKVVLKPLDFDRKWKFQYKPISGDVQLLSKKIPLSKYLNLQVLCSIQSCCSSIVYVVARTLYRKKNVVARTGYMTRFCAEPTDS